VGVIALHRFLTSHGAEWWEDADGVVRVLEQLRLPDFSWLVEIHEVATVEEARHVLGY
jgi:hypothetical protein